MTENISKTHKVEILVERDSVRKELSDSDWENLKMILDSNTEGYLKRCLWILDQIEK